MQMFPSDLHKVILQYLLLMKYKYNTVYNTIFILIYIIYYILIKCEGREEVGQVTLLSLTLTKPSRSKKYLMRVKLN